MREEKIGIYPKETTRPKGKHLHKNPKKVVTTNLYLWYPLNLIKMVSP